jgi:hypothetical protein
MSHVITAVVAFGLGVCAMSASGKKLLGSLFAKLKSRA